MRTYLNIIYLEAVVIIAIIYGCITIYTIKLIFKCLFVISNLQFFTQCSCK